MTLRRGFIALLACLSFVGSGAVCAPIFGQVTPPNYEECRLESIFPAGGRRGTAVAVELRGRFNDGFKNARDLIIDGPAGITVRDLKNASGTTVTATLEIAANAPPGLRCIRILNERSGLTNMLYFSVGRLPEAREAEPNNDSAAPQPVSLPVVVNGIVNPDADVDCFRFDLTKGQRLTAAVLAHAFDSHGQGKNYGVVDANLAILDSRGRVVAEAGDTLGLDPQVEFVAPEAGVYVARVSLEAFQGFPQAVYRLVLGEVALVTALFPAGGQRGATIDVELTGVNLPPGARQQVAVAKDDRFPMQQVLPDVENSVDLALPFVRGDYPERVEVEPNAQASEATPLDVTMTMNGRILEPGDVDWYRVKLTAGQSICLETTAQRFLRSPIDTLLQVYDPAGKLIVENDDGFALDYVSMHDFRPLDSRLTFTSPADGDYLIRVSDQAGIHGPRAVYRLTAAACEPTFELFLYPDGVPVWGPGTTAALLVKVVRWDNLNGDVKLRVEGLPPGWIASEGTSRSYESKPRQNPVMYQLLTITAPPDANPGDAFSFQVIGRAEAKGKTIERTALPLSLYYSSDTGYFRLTPQARIAVAQPQTPWLSTPVSRLTAEPGATVDIPVQVQNAGQLESIDLTADVTSSGVATAIGVPQAVAIKEGQALLSVKLPEHITAGHYNIVVSLRWRSDIRIGMPGPCTRLIHLAVGAEAISEMTK